MTADPSGRDTLRTEAAHWFNLRLSGDMTVADDLCFREWLGRSDAHREAYNQIDWAWIVAGTAAGDPALVARPEPDEPTVVRAAPRGRLLALAASLLLMIAVGWAVAPNFWPGSGVERQQQAFQTRTGQRTSVTLSDGSTVTLDSETMMRFRDTPDERFVELVGGRAFFRVARDPARPFIVSAGGKRVRAVGTAFEVSMENGTVAVILTEGKVRVDEGTPGSGNSTDMEPGRQLVIGADRNWTMTRVDVHKETSWTEGRLIFMHDPLAHAIDDMNRYSTKKLVFEGQRVPDREIVGVFQAGDVDGFVKALELNGIARPVSTTSEEIVLAANP